MDEKIDDMLDDSLDQDVASKKQGFLRRMSFKGKAAIALLLILFIGLGVVLYQLNEILESPLIYQGVKIENIPVSGVTKDQASKKVKDKMEKDIDGKIMTLTYHDKEYKVNIRELGFKYDYEKALKEAYQLGRKGKRIDRLKFIKDLKDNPVNIDLESSYDKSLANNIVGPIEAEINRDKIESTFKFNGGDFIVSDHQVGKVVNIEELIGLINNNIYDLKPIEIPVEDIHPTRTKELLTRINGVIGDYRTAFPTSTPGRKENIRISAAAMEKDIIMPGQTVSFNDLTGPRSIANGYKDSTVIVAGDYTSGVGGGVCQTSTTLYNALLQADMTIVQRSPHSIPAKYVPYGQDAAVAYGYLDLKFRNDYDFPIYIKSIYTGNELTFKIYGDQNAKNYLVKIQPETVEVIEPKTETIVDNSLAVGQKEVVQYGRTGYKVHTYKSKVKNGEVISRELITKDHYKSRNTVYRVGPDA